jgi:hypothetical protein
MRQDKAISHCNQGRLLQEEFEDTKGVQVVVLYTHGYFLSII